MILQRWALLKKWAWLHDESEKEEVDNTPTEEVESKLKNSLEKEFKIFFKSWRELARGSNWAEEFPELGIPNEPVDIF